MRWPSPTRFSLDFKIEQYFLGSILFGITF
uniref:Uncharacterized protein n=1 Tax=Rhizophora mucronata TaxID=61149 RepID=A0A2P2P7P7_RHIMU